MIEDNNTKPINNKKYGNKKKKDDKKTTSRPIAYTGPDQIVYEGSIVELDGSNSSPSSTRTTETSDGDDAKLSYSWTQTAGPEVTIKKDSDDVKNKKVSFKAPYVNIKSGRSSTDKKKPYTNLTFELVVTDENGISSLPQSVNIIVKMIQRALVFQGGGSLGAYEAGVFEALCQKLIEKDRKEEEEENGRRNRPLFDIIAGSSIGAVNAVIIVDSVASQMRRNGGRNANKDRAAAIWEGSVKQLNKFWDNISFPMPLLDNNIFFKNWWDFWHDFSRTAIENYKKSSFVEDNPLSKLNEEYPYPFYFFWPENYSPIASGEAARRYFSWISSLIYGVRGVLSPNFLQPDTKFLNPFLPFMRFDNTPLTKTIDNYWDYKNNPIKTSFEKGEPRLLLVSVDILDATSAVTFDSYLCESVYPGGKYKDGNEPICQHVIKYPKGIAIEHLIASMSPHPRYKYAKLEDIGQQQQKLEEDGKDTEKRKGGGGEEISKYRYFWDGAYLSNTPLREVIHLHRYYWHDKEGEQYVPHLEVYIVNLYPTVEKEDNGPPPTDADIIQDRELDIRFHDRTKYDIKVAEMISDYIILHGQIKNLALKYLNKYARDKVTQFQKEFEEILDKKEAKSKKRSKSTSRPYRDLIEGRFDLVKVIYIDRKDDGNAIFGKAAEFSSSTINKLREEGYNDAQMTVIN
jgi:NTE family protein